MSNIQQILGNPSPQIVVELQGQKINELQSELIITKTKLEDVAQYALALEAKVKELAEQLKEKEETSEVEVVEAEVVETK